MQLPYAGDRIGVRTSQGIVLGSNFARLDGAYGQPQEAFELHHGSQAVWIYPAQGVGFVRWAAVVGAIIVFAPAERPDLEGYLK